MRIRKYRLIEGAEVTNENICPTWYESFDGACVYDENNEVVAVRVPLREEFVDALRDTRARARQGDPKAYTEIAEFGFVHCEGYVYYDDDGNQKGYFWAENGPVEFLGADTDTAVNILFSEEEDRKRSQLDD